MRYFFAIVCPPLAVLLCNRMGSLFVNILLTCFFVVPGIIHALLVVNDKIKEERHQELISVFKAKK